MKFDCISYSRSQTKKNINIYIMHGIYSNIHVSVCHFHYIILFTKQAFSSDLNHYRILDCMGFVLDHSLVASCSPGVQMLHINYPGKHCIPFYWQGKCLDHQPPYNIQAIICGFYWSPRGRMPRHVDHIMCFGKSLCCYPFGRACILENFCLNLPLPCPLCGLYFYLRARDAQINFSQLGLIHFLIC